MKINEEKKQKTILIVDDNALNLRVLIDFLHADGYRVLISQSGEAALEQVDLYCPDLILLDIRMQGIDGFETCKRLKKKESTRDIPVIFMTALTDTQSKVEAFGTGAVDYLTKPIQQEEALARINNHITLVDQKRQIAEKEARIRAIIDSAEDTIYIKDQNFKYIMVNPAMERLLDCRAEDILGKGPKDIFGEEAGEHFLQMDRRVLAGETLTVEDHVPTPRGKRILSVIKTPIKNEKGEIISICGISRDITEKKRFREQLTEAKKREALATLAGGIAHEFNNKLFTITGNMDLIDLRLQNRFGKETGIADHVKAIQGSVKKMTRLTERLISYAMGGKNHSETVNLYDFIQEILPIISHTLPESVFLQTLYVNYRTNEPPFVSLDPTQMQMVLATILENAQEAMEGKGVIRVSVSPYVYLEPAPSGKDEKTGPYAEISIEDTGSGMEEEVKERIFEPFFSTKFQGRGLGMAAAYGIVSGHNGKILVESAKGQYTRVRVLLPQIKQEKAAELVEEDASIVKGKGAVLLVEDEKPVRKLVSAMLEHLGYEVIPAKNGEEALFMAEKHKSDIHAVLLDFKLPDIQGVDLLEKLSLILHKTPILISSGSTPWKTETGNISEIQLIRKPYSLTELSQKLSRLLHCVK